MQFRSFPIAKEICLIYYIDTNKKTNSKGKIIMFSNPKNKFIFQLICSFITLPIALMLTMAVLDSFFNVQVEFLENIVTMIDSSALVIYLANLPGKGSEIVLIASVVFHIIGFIASGGVKYALTLYLAALKITVSIPLIGIILVIFVAVLGIVFALALAPVFSFISAFKNYYDSKNLLV